MAPTLREEQLVLARRARTYMPGDVVILQHDGLEKIKRMQRLADGKVFVVGDNPGESTDSRTLGWLPVTSVIAKVIWPRAKYPKRAEGPKNIILRKSGIMPAYGTRYKAK